MGDRSAGPQVADGEPLVVRGRPRELDGEPPCEGHADDASDDSREEVVQPGDDHSDGGGGVPVSRASSSAMAVAALCAATRAREAALRARPMAASKGTNLGISKVR